MEKWFFRIIMILALVGGAYGGYACNKKWPTPSMSELHNKIKDQCQKAGAKYFTDRNDCIYEIEPGLKPVEKKD
jgi:hypothetical protein